MSEPPAIPTFGAVDLEGEHGLLVVEGAPRGICRLILVARTERGYPRRELAAIPLPTWRLVSGAAQRELVRGMDAEETGGTEPRFRPAKTARSRGAVYDQPVSNDLPSELALSPLVTRELAVLFWALMEDGEGTHIDALLAGWRQLAREERWWLFARASNPSQRLGSGWRRALFFALTDPADTRTAPRLLEIMESASAQKKTLGRRQPVSYLEPRSGKKKAAKKAIKKTATKAAKSPAAPKTARKSTPKKPVEPSSALPRKRPAKASKKPPTRN